MRSAVGHSTLALKLAAPSVSAPSAQGLTTYARAYSLRRQHRLRPWHALWPFLRPIALSSWLWGLPPLDHLTLVPTPHLLALSPQRRSQAGPTLTWRGRSAVLCASQSRSTPM